MNNTIEITQSTIVKILLAITLFSLLLFFMNRYDRSTKEKKLEACVNDLIESKITGEITRLMESIDIDSTEATTDKLLPKIKLMVGDFKRLNKYDFQIIVTGDFGYKILTNRNSNPKKRAFTTQESIAESVELMIMRLEAPNVNIVKENLKYNSENEKKRIIIPLSISEKEASYLNVGYYENIRN